MDTKAGHTRGPWEAVPHTEGLSAWDYQDGWWDIFPVDRTPTRVPIATLDHHRDSHGPAREKALSDARLIAAAPQLLEALISSQGIQPLRMELEDCMDEERDFLAAELESIEAQIEAAIVKATGATS